MSLQYKDGNIYEIFIEAALAAGRKIMAIYEAGDVEVSQKEDASPVTQADLAADEEIARHLRAHLPDIPLITEEQADSHLTSSERFVIVDPLDGTKEFINRRGEFTVNIALVENGVPRIGVVYAPAIGRLFFTDDVGKAWQSKGDFTQDKRPDAVAMQVAKADNDALRVVASKSHRDAATDEYIGQYQVADMVSAGSSLKFCLVASGEADLYPRLGRTMEWDTAAGDAVLRAAGGKVVRLDDHTPLGYGKEGNDNPFFLAVGAGVALVAAKGNDA